MNKNLFSTKKQPAPTNTVNNAGGRAYKLGDKEALAQMVATGCFGNTFYVKAEDQLDQVIALAQVVPAEFLARLAVYAREEAYMKDSPAVLAAILSVRDVNLFKMVASQVLNNMKMIRNFITVVRSGKIGRKSLGSAAKKYIRRYIDKLTDEKLFSETIGQSPSFKDIINLVHPKPATKSRQAMFRYILGMEHAAEDLPIVVQQLEAFKADNTKPLPSVDWQQLTAYNLTQDHWKQIARSMNWHALRMNLNTLARNNVLSDKSVVTAVATKLADTNVIKKINLFPYQVYNTLINVENPPKEISDALQDALEASVSNLKAFDNIDRLYICIDQSGSMSNAVTSGRGSATSKVTCTHVAAVYAGAIAKANSKADVRVFTFDTGARRHNINTRDSMYTISRSLTANGGGTRISAAFEAVLADSLVRSERIGIVVISDNESWADYYRSHSVGTSSAKTLIDISNRVKSVKTVLLDITPNKHTQIQESKDVMNIGGFSDSVFEIIHNFVSNDGRKWTDVINAIQIPTAVGV